MRIPFVTAGGLLAVILSGSAAAASLPDTLLQLPITFTSGERTSLAEYQGKKPVYLKFWASWCEPCQKEMPHFQYIQDTYGDTIEVIGVNIGINDTPERAAQIIKQFSLTMPTAIDTHGDLTQAFRMVGTPYHLLLDRDMQLIHRGHEANDVLDRKIDRVSRTQPVDLLDAKTLVESAPDVALNTQDGKMQALFFVATWCDWYFEEREPDTAKHCVAAQKQINALAEKHPNIVWQGIATRLWTGDEELATYTQRHDVTHAFTIDHSNRLFHRFGVKDLPTLVLVKDDKAVATITDFSDTTQLRQRLNP